MLAISVSLIGIYLFSECGLQRGEGGFSGLVDHVYLPYYKLTGHHEEEEQVLLLLNLYPWLLIVEEYKFIQWMNPYIC